jgi:hypothetical protein
MSLSFRRKSQGARPIGFGNKEQIFGTLQQVPAESFAGTGDRALRRASIPTWWSKPCDHPFGWEAPVKQSILAGASFEAAQQVSCLSILVSAASMRWTVCGWRKRQPA